MCWQLQFVHKWTKYFNLLLFKEKTKWVNSLFFASLYAKRQNCNANDPFLVFFFFWLRLIWFQILSTTAFYIRLQNYSSGTNKRECISTIQFIESDSIKIRSEKVSFLCQYYKLHNFKMSTKMWIIWSSFLSERKKKSEFFSKLTVKFHIFCCCCHEIINRRRCQNNQQSWFRSTAFNLCTDFPS